MTSLSASKFDTRARNPQGSWLGIGRPHSVWNNAQGSTIGGPVDREIATIKSEEGVDSFAFGEVHQGGVGYLGSGESLATEKSAWSEISRSSGKWIVIVRELRKFSRSCLP
jgi:hypothetical protein